MLLEGAFRLCFDVLNARAIAFEFFQFRNVELSIDEAGG